LQNPFIINMYSSMHKNGFLGNGGTAVKKYIAVLLAVCLLLSCVSVFAEQPAARAELKVSKADADGFSTLTFTVYNAEFQGVQTDIYYKQGAVSVPDGALSDIEIGENARDLFGADLDVNVLSSVIAKNDAKKNRIQIAAIVNLGQPMPNRYVDENRCITADENGLLIFKLRIKIEGNVENVFSFSSKEGSEESDGVILALAGDSLDVQTEILYEESGKKVAGRVSGKSSAPAKSDDEKRKERIADTVILQVGNYAATVGGVLKWADDQNKSVKPYIKADRVMVPLRFIAESFGATVSWEDETQKISIKTADGRQIALQVGNGFYETKGETFPLDAPPEITSNRTFVPLRAVAETLGKNVLWLEGTKSVVISPADNPWNESGGIESALLNDALMIMSPLVRDMK
jgi:hypothetical protein